MFLLSLFERLTRFTFSRTLKELLNESLCSQCNMKAVLQKFTSVQFEWHLFVAGATSKLHNNRQAMTATPEEQAATMKAVSQ